MDTQVKQKLYEADVEADSDIGSLPDQLVHLFTTVQFQNFPIQLFDFYLDSFTLK